MQNHRSRMVEVGAGTEMILFRFSAHARAVELRDSTLDCFMSS